MSDKSSSLTTLDLEREVMKYWSRGTVGKANILESVVTLLEVKGFSGIVSFDIRRVVHKVPEFFDVDEFF